MVYVKGHTRRIKGKTVWVKGYFRKGTPNRSRVRPEIIRFDVDPVRLNEERATRELLEVDWLRKHIRNKVAKQRALTPDDELYLAKLDNRYNQLKKRLRWDY